MVIIYYVLLKNTRSEHQIWCGGNWKENHEMRKWRFDLNEMKFDVEGKMIRLKFLLLRKQWIVVSRRKRGEVWLLAWEYSLGAVCFMFDDRMIQTSLNWIIFLMNCGLKRNWGDVCPLYFWNGEMVSCKCQIANQLDR